MLKIEQCDAIVLYTLFVAFAAYQLLTSYQIYIARKHLKNKIQQEAALITRELQKKWRNLNKQSDSLANKKFMLETLRL